MEETENTAIIRAGGTVTVNPRRGSQDKAPWKDLPLSEITGQTIETSHVYNVHLGETVVPYATLEPLKAVLPVKKGEFEIPTDVEGPGGIRLGGLERRMRERWNTISDLWDDKKRRANMPNLLGQLDYMHKLSSQLEWQRDHQDRPIRLAYTKSGQPTAAILRDDTDLLKTSCFGFRVRI